MLTQLSMKFQCHEGLLIDLEQITTIIGPNDSGKSAILRALKWLAFNEWPGKADGFIPHGKDEAMAMALIDDHCIIRKKSGKENLYILDDQEYRAFHPHVPESIVKVLNLKSDNFQDQHDPAFWLMLNSGQAAGALNDIFNLQAIDTATGNLNSELRLARSRVTVAEGRLTESEKTRDALIWTKDASRDLDRLEELQKVLQQLCQLQTETTTAMEELDKLLALEVDIAAALEMAEDALEVGKGIETLNEEITQLKYLQELESQEKSMANSLKTKEAQLKKWLSGQCPLCGRQ